MFYSLGMLNLSSKLFQMIRVRHFKGQSFVLLELELAARRIPRSLFADMVSYQGFTLLYY